MGPIGNPETSVRKKLLGVTFQKTEEFRYQRFGGICCLRIEIRRVTSCLRMEATVSSEVLGTTCYNTRRHNPVDGNLHAYRRENLSSQ